ncbi:hypothetical protein E2C01_098215 [Portunus trituberculatus]|uniref:Uncharacterized protein n=1 Tax=Portunus trituberculatus TaxID=210409 RepID=A0A5B7K0P0_PORTR|nr:hypothetical protein [Portunus trituberculatus]
MWEGGGGRLGGREDSSGPVKVKVAGASRRPPQARASPHAVFIYVLPETPKTSACESASLDTAS